MARGSGGAKADRCQPIRNAIDATDAEIAQIEADLDSDEILDAIKKRLPEILRKLGGQRAQLDKALERCKAIPALPRPR